MKVKSWLLAGFAAVTWQFSLFMAAQGVQACPPTSCSVTPEQGGAISKILKERVQLLPPEGSLSIGILGPSSFNGLEQANITLNYRGNSKTMPLFESGSGAYILFGQPFDISSETDAGIAADMRSFFSASNPINIDHEGSSVSPLPGLDMLRASASSPDVARNFFVIHGTHTLLVGPVMVTDGRYNSLINSQITSRPGFEEGPKNAPITIVEYSDLACPACRDMHAFLVGDLLAQYPGRVRLIYRNFPMTHIHPGALLAARAASCVASLKPAASAAYVEYVFAHQAELKDNAQASVTQAAEAQGVNTDFKKCLASQSSFESVQADVLEGSSVGVATTPTIFLNGEAFIGMPPKDMFAARIAEAIRAKDRSDVSPKNSK